MSSAEIVKEVKAENIKAGRTSRVVYRAPSGMFQRKAKAPTAVEFQQAVAAKLLTVSPEKPKSDFEEIIEAQTIIAKDTDLDRGTSSQKAAEFLVKAAGLYLAKPEDQPRGMIVVRMTEPNLPTAEPRVLVTKPSEWFLQKYSTDSLLTAEVISIETNPAPKQLTAAQLAKDHNG